MLTKACGSSTIRRASSSRKSTGSSSPTSGSSTCRNLPFVSTAAAPGPSCPRMAWSCRTTTSALTACKSSATDQQIAFYGGDPDNFEYPRYDLDICFFRVYENGKPAQVEHYLRWSKAGAGDGELIFVSGQPGVTSRLSTMAELEYARNVRLPYALNRLRDLEVALASYSARSDDNARKAKEDLFSVQNARKAYDGELAGLFDPSLLAKKKSDEEALRSKIIARDDFKDVLGAWDRIAHAQNLIRENARLYNVIEAGHGFNSLLFHISRALLRAAEEKPKPNH